MPIFEYRCSDCENEFEHLVLKSPASPKCPACGSHRVEKMMSTPTVSSEQTRRRAKQDIRARNRALRKDHAHEEVKRIESHAKDHDD